MEGNDAAFPYFYQHRLLHLAPAQGEPGTATFADAADPSGMFPPPSSSSAPGEGAGTPTPFPPSALAASVAGGRASPLAPAPVAETPRRKRGRPRKYGPQPSSTPAPPPSSSAAAKGFSPPSGYGVNKVSSSPSLPLGSSPPPRPAPGRKKAKQESVGKGGQNFTPHLLTVAAGEDVIQQIMSFVQQQRRAVCIISASGTISTATLRQPATSGGHLTYEGHFDIVSLSGSFLPTETGGVHSRTGALSICFSNKHSIFGGGVGGRLVAAGPVQILAGSFSIGSKKSRAVPVNVVEEKVSKLSTPFAEPEVPPSVVIWPTEDSSGRTVTNSVTDDRHESSGGSGNSSMLQSRGDH